MKHGRSFAELALAVAAVLLVAACGSGPGDPPDPLPHMVTPRLDARHLDRRSPVPETPITGTVEVTAYNVVAKLQVGGVAQELDLTMAEQGGASIRHFTGSNEGKQEFGFDIALPDGVNQSFICSEVDSATMRCLWNQTTPQDMEGTPLVIVLTK